jgi:selenocysteine-specific elongation factor
MTGGPPLTLGTAGHIDHGKTALITLLTGKNTDRLREERERGISIELGYAELELPSGRSLSVVDVPGHERFVRTMVAGASGVDLFLLVVAADDGVMPQTVEHVAILELLGVRRGVVAITKADLADDELLEMVETDVRQFLAGTSYAATPLVTVSARDGRGVPELLSALDQVAGDLATARAAGPARLPVDRSFVLKGIGTVVTGTLWRGEVKAGDELLVQPGGHRVTVRSVQVHDHAVDAAHGGQRAGINLRGAGRGEIERGQWLAASSPFAAVTRSFEAWVKLLPGVSPPSGQSMHAELHHGTSQTEAQISFGRRLLPTAASRQRSKGRDFPDGVAAAAIVRVDAELALEAGDRFILRLPSPVRTLGGGVVLDVRPRRWRRRADYEAFTAALHEHDVAAAALVLAASRAVAGVSAADLLSAAVPPRELTPVLERLQAAGQLEELAGGAGGDREAQVAAGECRWFVPGALAGLTADLVAALAARATERPERPAMPATELAALAPGLAPELLAALLATLVARGRLVAGEGGFALAGAGSLSPSHEALAVELLDRLSADPLAPPTLAALAEGVGRPRPLVERILEVLVRRGELVRAEKDLWFAAGAVASARGTLELALARDGQVTLAVYRDLVGTGRRNAQALLELFDRQGVTRRVGDAHVSRSRRPPAPPATPPGRPST